VSGNMLAIVLAVAGILVGFVTSWWFTRSSKRNAEEERVILQKEISALRGLLSDVAESAIRSTATESGIDKVPQATRVPVKVPDSAAASPPSTAATSTIDVLVRTSLGALLNEHGEVSVPRLFREVTHALPDASLPSIVSSLEELRKAGRISWSGDDVRKAEVIRVHPQ